MSFSLHIIWLAATSMPHVFIPFYYFLGATAETKKKVKKKKKNSVSVHCVLVAKRCRGFTKYYFKMIKKKLV